LQSEAATQNSWFEISCRLGKQLSMNDWKEKFLPTFKGKKMVKIVGFDGANVMLGVPWNQVQEELEKHEIVLWDADWFCEKGWTGCIANFLEAKKDGRAVAFQKKAEVPGFHRQYWHIYKRFPDRVWMVVLEDDPDEKNLSDGAKAKLDWLDARFEDKTLSKPDTWEGAKDKYVKLALMAREAQGLTPVIAINGGRSAAAQAAVETMMPNVDRVTWTIFPGLRTSKGVAKVEEENTTVIEFAKKHEEKHSHIQLRESQT